MGVSMLDDVRWDDDTRCLSAFPGLGCGKLWEMISLAICFWISALLSAFFVHFTVRKSKSRCAFADQSVLFWLFLMVWQLYQGAITFFPIPWNRLTFRLLHEALAHVLVFIPMCLSILILFELLFTYRNPGANAISFFRRLFMMFMVTFVLLGIAMSVVDVANDRDGDESLLLWRACTDLIIAVFFALPAWSLLQAVTYPMVQPEDVGCVRACHIGIVVYVIVFLGRIAWNASHYFGFNAAQEWLLSDGAVRDWDGPVQPSVGARIVNFACALIFDGVPSVLSMVAVYLFKKHDMMFDENPYYTQD
jgi:hypothetical protein